MKDFFSVKRYDLILFILFGAIYVGFQFVWALAIVGDGGPDAPGQNASKIATLGMLTLMATLYAIVSMWFAWRNGDQGDNPPALFMVKQGLAMALYICVGQILAVATPQWHSPTQGIPVMYTLCMGGFIGIVLASIGANLLWTNKREAFLAQGAKKR